MATLYHTRHSCGHAVYWEDWRMGIQCAVSPCPWCGAETGLQVDGDVILMSGSVVVRKPDPDGRMPWHAARPMPDKIVVHHMTGDVCCHDA